MRFFEKYKEILFFMCIYWSVCFIMLVKSASFLYVMLAWNVLLALAPLFFIGKAKSTIVKRKVGWSICWLILWLFFFPNSVYMVTDFIHLSSDSFMQFVEAKTYASESGVVYSNELFVWAKLLVIGMGFFFALVVGLESFYLFEQIIRQWYSTVGRYFFMSLVALLAGIGVYIGRFLRFNSWDLLFNPLQILKQLAILNGFAVQFISLFTLFVLGSYILYRTLRKQGSERI